MATLRKPKETRKVAIKAYEDILAGVHAKIKYNALVTQIVEEPQESFKTREVLAMAKNIFVRGEYKRLSEAIRRHKKDSLRLTQKLLAHSQQEQIFQSTDKRGSTS